MDEQEFGVRSWRRTSLTYAAPGTTVCTPPLRLHLQAPESHSSALTPAHASGRPTAATALAEPAGSLPAQDQPPGHFEQATVQIVAPAADAPAQPAESVAAMATPGVIAADSARSTPPPKPWERAAQANGTTMAATAQTQPAGSLPAQDQPQGHFEQPAVIAAPAAAAAAQPAKSVAAAATPPDPVEQAVRFLTRPTMQQAPLGTKRNFMANKGLTPSQVDEALRRAGLQTTPADTAAAVAPVAVAAAQSSRLSWWAALAAAAAAGAAGVALARLLLPRAGPEAHAAQPAERAGAAARDRVQVAAAQDPAQTPPRRMGSAAKAHTPQFEVSLGVIRQLAAHARSGQALVSRAPAFGAALRAACSGFGSSVTTTGSPAVNTTVSAALTTTGAAAVNTTGSAAVNTTGGEPDTGGRAGSELVHALHTLVVVVNSMLLHPDNPRFHRIASSNANMRRLIQAMPEALDALGFLPCSGGAHWQWHTRAAAAAAAAQAGGEGGGEGGGGGEGAGVGAGAEDGGVKDGVNDTVGEGELADLREAKALLQEALAEARSASSSQDTASAGLNVP